VFGLLKKRVSAEQLAKSLARNAVNLDACSAMVSMMRDHTVADEIAVFEFAFLRISHLRRILAEYVNGGVLDRMIEVINREAIAAFSGKEKNCGREAATHYQRRKMSDVAKERLTAYREMTDSPSQTSPVFCARVGARSVMMNVEVQAILNDLLEPSLRKSLASIKAV
jgi:hypothetical protein